MANEVLDQYRQASAWTADKAAGAASQLDAPTPCDDWDVRTLLSHMVETQRYFLDSARGEKATPPGPEPRTQVGDDPARELRDAQQAVADAFAQPGVIDRTGPSLGIAFADQLIHGWDVARATGQDTTMPDGLARSAYDMIHGRFTDEQRAGTFKPEVPVGDDASPQQRLLAYTGRQPD
jgi:uncharacterized protein (TIGR03086 family)